MTTITITRLSSAIRQACAATLRVGTADRLREDLLYATEHSPIRTDIYWIEMLEIPSFVSVHFTRHPIGVQHFVQTSRDDRGGAGDNVVTRLTPVNHCMMANAQALINIARKRLCLKAHIKTVGVMRKIRREMTEVNPALAEVMVPECTFRNGLCPEKKVCRAGIDRVCAAYPEWPGHRRIG